MSTRKYIKAFYSDPEMLQASSQYAVGRDKREMGRYSIPEAAASLGVPQRTMRSWFLGSRRIFTPAFHHGDSVLLSFYDVTEAYVIEVLRSHWDFNPKKLRQALARLRARTRFSRPLLRRELSVIPEFQNLVATVPEKGKHVHVDVAHEGNLVFEGFVRSMAMRITRDSKGKPVRIYPWKDPDSSESPVSMDPDIMSGELVVAGTRIPAKTILRKKLSGKTVREIATSHHLSPEVVRKVLQHFEREKS
jgi:uncharacterized protein (DUF433 family)